LGGESLRGTHEDGVDDSAVVLFGLSRLVDHVIAL
jgi:hypothetical protein